MAGGREGALRNAGFRDAGWTQSPVAPIEEGGCAVLPLICAPPIGRRANGGMNGRVGLKHEVEVLALRLFFFLLPYVPLDTGLARLVGPGESEDHQCAGAAVRLGATRCCDRNQACRLSHVCIIVTATHEYDHAACPARHFSSLELSCSFCLPGQVLTHLGTCGFFLILKHNHSRTSTGTAVAPSVRGALASDVCNRNLGFGRGC